MQPKDQSPAALTQINNDCVSWHAENHPFVSGSNTSTLKDAYLWKEA